MGRRVDMTIVGAATMAAVLAIGGTAGADFYEPDGDLPDGSPAAPAAATPSSTTAVVSMLDNGDIDAVTICVDDPAALHVQVGGVDDAGAPRSMDTVMWLFDADGLLVASNDDAPSGGLGSELVPGSAAATDAGVHTVAVGHFRAYPRDAVGTRMSDPGSGPLETWRTGFGSNEGRYQLDLLAGASGSEGCGESGGAGVRTGNGRCQELGGKGAEKGKAHGLKKNADKRQNRAC